MSIPGPGGEPADGDAGAVEAAGHFRIYLGAAGGVGKSYATLRTLLTGAA